MCPNHASVHPASVAVKVPDASPHEPGTRARVEFANEDNSTLQLHAYARARKSRLSTPLRAGRQVVSTHAC